MNAVRNYQKELEELLEELEAKKEVPKLFLHSCCAPCSSYVLEYLRQYFRITVFYYNPNISTDSEYEKRVKEQKRLIASYNQKVTEKVVQGYEITIEEGAYEPECFYEIAKGLEQCKEGGERCFACYELRLQKTAMQAKKEGFDYFATTLTISPLKNAVKLNEIGEKLAKECNVAWLPSDFKKKNGYKRSIELSKEYELYRQDYCGCAYSKAERERIEKEKGMQTQML